MTKRVILLLILVLFGWESRAQITKETVGGTKEKSYLGGGYYDAPAVLVKEDVIPLSSLSSSNWST